MATKIIDGSESSEAINVAMEDFTQVAGNFSYTYNETTGRGDGWIKIVPKTAFGYYSLRKIALNAGGLKREITVSRAVIFAMSNIVRHTDGTLYFAEDKVALTTNKTGVDLTSAQGLLFRWGSLLGLEGATAGAWNSSMVVFTPGEYTGNPEAWGALYPPFMEQSAGYSYNRDEFIKAYPSVGYNAAAGKGDICRYISDKGWVTGKWRIPTELEIEKLIPSGNSDLSNPTMFGLKYPTFNATFAQQVTTDINGKDRMTYGYYLGPGVKTTSSTTITNISIIPFPLTGYRNQLDGQLEYELKEFYPGGYYWMSSVHSTYKLSMYYLDNDRVEQVEYPHANGLSVRCVRDL